MASRVGVVEIELFIRDSHSLKEKRRVLKSLKDRLRNTFNIAVAEVSRMDHHQMAVLAATTVSNDGRYVQGQLSRVVDFVRRCPHVELSDYAVEVF